MKSRIKGTAWKIRHWSDWDRDRRDKEKIKSRFARNPLALYNLSHEKRAALANPGVRPAC
jgi:hypothetical protein